MRWRKRRERDAEEKVPPIIQKELEDARAQQAELEELAKENEKQKEELDARMKEEAQKAEQEKKKKDVPPPAAAEQSGLPAAHQARRA